MTNSSNRFLFLGGSPKCGTTYLFNLLKFHPELNVSKKKETYYFLDEEHTGINKDFNVYKNGVDGFLNYFDPLEKECYLEATSHLIYQKDVFDFLKSLGEIKIVFILRNPVKRIVSTFEFTKNNLGNIKDNIEYTLGRYVDLLLDGKDEKLKGWLRNSDGEYVFRNELDYCNYYPFVEAWVKEFGESNIKVIQFEDFIEKKEEYLSEIQIWAGLKSLDLLQLGKEKKNKGVVVKNTWLHHQSIKLAKLLPSSRFKSIVKQIYFLLQKSKVEKGKINEHSIKRLNEYFNHSNRMLEQEFAFDLSKWKN